jgi:hypothetical protein
MNGFQAAAVVSQLTCLLSIMWGRTQGSVRCCGVTCLLLSDDACCELQTWHACSSQYVRELYMNNLELLM